MKWNAWGDPAAAKPLSEGIRTLLKQAVGVEDSAAAELEPDRCACARRRYRRRTARRWPRSSARAYCRTDDRDRLLHAGGKSTLDLLRRKDHGMQDAPDAILLPGDDDAVAAVLRYCSEHGIAVIPFGGGTSVVGGLDPIRGEFQAVVSLDLRRFDQLHLPRRSVRPGRVRGRRHRAGRRTVCLAPTAFRSDISRRASNTPPSGALPRRARPARTRPATAGSTTWCAGCGWSPRWARWIWAARRSPPRAPTCAS